MLAKLIRWITFLLGVFGLYEKDIAQPQAADQQAHNQEIDDRVEKEKQEIDGLTHDQLVNRIREL